MSKSWTQYSYNGGNRLFTPWLALFSTSIIAGCRSYIRPRLLAQAYKNQFSVRPFGGLRVRRVYFPLPACYRISGFRTRQTSLARFRSRGSFTLSGSAPSTFKVRCIQRWHNFGSRKFNISLTMVRRPPQDFITYRGLFQNLPKGRFIFSRDYSLAQ